MAATPGWDFMPAPISDTLPISSSVATRLNRSPCIGSSVLRVISSSVRGTVNEMSASAPSDTGSFCTIMSTLTFASASAPKIAPGHAGAVGDAEQGDARLLPGVRDGGDERSFHGFVL